MKKIDKNGKFNLCKATDRDLLLILEFIKDIDRGKLKIDRVINTIKDVLSARGAMKGLFESGEKPVML